MCPKSTSNPIEADFDSAIESANEHSVGDTGPVGNIASTYTLESDRLLGFLLKLDYSEMDIATCDPWKRKCGGVPRNSFIIVRLSKNHVGTEDQHLCNRVILGRVTNSVPTPVASDVLSTLFEVHKAQAMMDPYTTKELQWSAMRASIVGTFYDDGENEIAFGNDVDTFYGAHAYEVYSPSPENLEALINSFISAPSPLEVGHLRYTETPNAAAEEKVSVKVDPLDFVGTAYGQRTALFGKTRFGKSNTIKVIADTIMSADTPPGQIIFDPSGEYTYWNEQDNGSLFILHKDKSERYSLDPKSVPQESQIGISQPNLLKVNFYDAVSVGHSLITQLWETVNHGPWPGYMVPIMEWSAPDPSDAPPRRQHSEFHHFWRTMSLWFGLLKLAGFQEPTNKQTFVDFPGPVKTNLLADPNVTCATNANGNFSTQQPISNLPSIYKAIADYWDNGAGAATFRPNGGAPYFDDLEDKMLRILRGQRSLTGHNYIRPFARFHDPNGSSIFQDITQHARSGKTVFVEMARADEQLRRAFSERICQQLLFEMMEEFTHGTLGDRFVVVYFEESHTLFRADDKDLGNVYNKLAKEGAKFHISMVYATQSMTTLSPDLLKNTENFFIAHLDDDREVREVTRKYVFKDVAEDVQRTQSKGYVRMITASHRFALPVQINKFSPAAKPPQGDEE